MRTDTWNGQPAKQSTASQSYSQQNKKARSNKKNYIKMFTNFWCFRVKLWKFKQNKNGNTIAKQL